MRVEASAGTARAAQTPSRIETPLTRRKKLRKDMDSSLGREVRVSCMNATSMENAAIKSGINPRESTMANIEKMRVALKRMGMSYDFGDEIITSEPAIQ